MSEEPCDCTDDPCMHWVTRTVEPRRSGAYAFLFAVGLLVLIVAFGCSDVMMVIR